MTAPTEKTKARRMMHLFRPRKSVRAPEGKEPTMQPKENIAVIQPESKGGGGEGRGKRRGGVISSLPGGGEECSREGRRERVGGS